jgi:Xaa-Pro aminopeptidase
MNDYDSRVAKLQQLMREENVDIGAVGPTSSMRYILGDTPHPDERFCVLIITWDGLQLIVPKLNAQKVQSFTDIEMMTWEDAEGPARAIQNSLLSRDKIGRLATDGAMRADFLLQLLSVAQPEETVPLDPLLSNMRIRKSAREIEFLHRAAKQADKAMAAAVEVCRPGVTEKEIAWEAESAFRRDGADEVIFTLIAAGPNGSHPHHYSGTTVLRKGDGVIIDIGASLDGYKSDITRVVHLGSPSGEFQRMYDIVLRANENARSMVHQGVSAREIDRAARSVIEGSGFGDLFIHRTGHGIGLDVHEHPYINEINTQILRKGMTFSIEPGIYVPGKFGIRIEDVVVVTPDGSCVLTGFDHEIVVKR